MNSEKTKKQIQKWISGMAKFNSTPEYGTTRILFTKTEIANRNYIKSEMSKLGLEVEEDAIGNIFATHRGMDSALAPIWSGSHIDTIPNAGNFDGMAGVVCAMAALQEIIENQIPHKRDIKVVVYTSEEPTRYGLSCLGSRALAGELSLEETKELYDRDQKTLYQKLIELGYDVEHDYADVAKKPGEVYASVELHIEQNRRLEDAKKKIGIVRKICAPSNYIVELTGTQSHAGGTDMYDRKDAFAALCEMSLLLEKLARDCDSEYNTATIGHIEVFPNAMNTIPGKVSFTVDVRDCNWDTKQILIEEFTQGFEEIAQRRQIKMEIRTENNDIPLKCDTDIVELIKEKCEKRNLDYLYAISGPYHDSLFVGKIAPTAMIFVPSKDGISHAPEEWTDYEDLVTGSDLLMEVLLELADRE